MRTLTDDLLEMVVIEEFARLETDGYWVARDMELTLARRVAQRLRREYERPHPALALTPLESQALQQLRAVAPGHPGELSPDLEQVAQTLVDKLANGDTSQIGEAADYLLCDEDWDRVWARAREIQVEEVEAVKRQEARRGGR